MNNSDRKIEQSKEHCFDQQQFLAKFIKITIILFPIENKSESLPKIDKH